MCSLTDIILRGIRIQKLSEAVAMGKTIKLQVSITMPTAHKRKMEAVAAYGISQSHILRDGLAIIAKDVDAWADPSADKKLVARAGFTLAAEYILQIDKLTADKDLPKAEIVRRAIAAYLSTNDGKLRDIVPGYAALGEV